MGGLGSGNWYRWGPKRRCVEHCYSLDMAFLLWKGWLKPGAVTTGTVSWTYGDTLNASQITLTVDLSDLATACVRVSYTLSGESVAYSIRLTSSRPQYGGTRWWFVCPLVVRQVPCGRRVRKLYRAGQYFGCRQCYGLTYNSRQEHDARVSRLMKNPDLIRAMMDSGSFGQSFLAMKAALKLTGPRNFV